MLFVFYFLLLQMNLLLILVQYNGYHDLMTLQVADDFAEVATHKRPFLLSFQFLANFGLIAEYNDLRFALSLFQVATD